MSAGSYAHPGAPVPAKVGMMSSMLPTVPTAQGYRELPDLDGDAHVGKGAVRDARDLKLKRLIRRLRVFARSFALVVSTALTISMAVTLHKYLSTRDIVIDGRTAWAHDTKTWPTLMLLVVAALSAAVNLAVLFAYMRDVAAANKTETLSTIVVWGGHITVWGTTAALYRYGKDTNGVSNDLWGWTCSQSAATIQAPFNNVVHFPTFCHVQSGSWYISILQTIAEILTAGIWMLVIGRWRRQKRMKTRESSIPFRTF
ncbi:MAG: hypothetical protein M1838_001745 [Thelocarpon superellum]|nr:MAG: hypothetical protein M1838_001745 [Thelocarpon superellum]